MQTFFCKTRVITGKGSLQSLKELSISRLFVVTDPYFFENGKAMDLVKLIGPEAYGIFHEITPDPTVTLAAKATAAAKELKPDTVLALGGGSAIDCAKAVSYFLEGAAQLVAVPTTSGSGSEVTSFSVLTHEGNKYPLVDDTLCPQVAILDSELVASLPKALIADGGFDVISHATESFVATGANAITRALSKEAFRTTLACLPASFGGDLQARDRIHTASTVAGLAFTGAGLGLCHSLAHVLGGMFHVPHGRLNAILLPAVIHCNAHSAGGSYAELARSAEISGASDTVAVRSLVNHLIRLRKQCNLPGNLREAGIDPRLLRQAAPQLIQQALKDPCTKTNPLPVADFMIRRILDEVSGSV